MREAADPPGKTPNSLKRVAVRRRVSRRPLQVRAGPPGRSRPAVLQHVDGAERGPVPGRECGRSTTSQFGTAAARPQQDRIKHALESYYLPCACHWYSPTFMLTLARLVEPTEHWAVRTGPEHTTVVNRARTRVFDLIYWGLKGRLENYLFGDTIKSHDASMGGELAFANSRPERRKRRKR